MARTGNRPLTWRRSSACSDITCVEFAEDGSAVYLRNNQVADGPVVRFTRPEWAAFVDGVKQGEFDAA